MILTKKQLIDLIKESFSRIVNTREYSDIELDDEADEYFENEKTKERFPNAFLNKDDLKEKIKTSKNKVLSTDELLNLENSDVGDLFLKKDALRYVKKLGREYDRDVDSVINGMKSGHQFPPPIVIKDNNSLYLLAGNTRLMVSIVLHMKFHCKIIDLNHA